MRQIDRYALVGWIIGFVVTGAVWYGIVALIKMWL
jgi:hypothetical protein